VNEAALIVLGSFLGEALIVEFAGQILAAADKLQGFLDRRIVLGNAGSNQGLDGKGAVGHIRRFLAVVAKAAELGLLRIGVSLIELDTLDEIGRFFEKVIVFAVLVGLLESHDGHAGGVIGEELGIDAAVLLDLFFQVGNGLGQERLLGAVAVL